MQKGPHSMQPILNARLYHTLHRGLFSSKANGLLKLIRPEKNKIGESECGAMHQPVCAAAVSSAEIHANGETVTTANIIAVF